MRLIILPALAAIVMCVLLSNCATFAPGSDPAAAVIRIEAEDYDDGGEGVGYHDLTPGNTGDQYRNDGVDIEVCFDGGYNVGWIQQGEWLQYSGIEGDGQTWHVRLRVGSKDRVGRLRILVNGAEALPDVRFEPTGGFQVWEIIEAGPVELAKGGNVIRIVSEENMLNLDWFELSPTPHPPDTMPRRMVVRPRAPGAAPAPSPRENPRLLISLSREDVEQARAAANNEEFNVVDSIEKDEQALVVSRKIQVDAIKSAGIPIHGESRDVPFKYLMDGWVALRERYSPVNEQGAIVVNQGYHDEMMIEQLLRALADAYPGIADLREIGRSWNDLPMWALKISDNPRVEEDEPAVLFNGAHHGSELLSSEFVLDQIEYLLTRYGSDPEVTTWVNEFEIWCVPLVNPDGRHRFLHLTGSGRKNGRDTNENGVVDATDGVDLNRNYPFRWNTGGEKASRSDPAHSWYRGPEPASEPETRAMMRLAEEQRFVTAISWHTVATKILVPYTIDDVKNPEPSVPWMIGEEMAALSDSMRDDRDYTAVRNLYSVDGVDQDWHYWKFGTIAYIWEGPRHNPDYAELRDLIIEGARPGWIYLLDRIAKGPTVSGRVVDATTGRPIEAMVRVDEIKTFEGEMHTSHPESGRFDRLLPESGEYHLTVARDGYSTETIKIQVGDEWKRGIVLEIQAE